MIIHHIVDTLKKDPENGVIKLLEKVATNAKTNEDRLLIAQILTFYQTNSMAKIQIRNLVHNTHEMRLHAFFEKIYDVLKPPFIVSFLPFFTMEEADKLTSKQSVFPIIDLKNLNNPGKQLLLKLKNQGHIFFCSILVTNKNFNIVTSDDVILTLIKHGVRGIFYRTTDDDLDEQIRFKINQIRKHRPILAFYIKKDPPNGKSSHYLIAEQVGDRIFEIKLQL